VNKLIELKNVTKYYGNRGLGLYKADIKINTGEIVGILGENGSGKTTMLKTIMGLGELKEGEVLIEGKAPAQMHEKMAFISEEGTYFPNMSPYEYGIFLTDFIPSFDMQKYNKLLKFFDIEPYKKIRTFSRGQKTKVEIAAGFSKGAKYILMDEPFLGEDMFTRQDFLKLMVSNIKEDETILISTHLIGEIENLIDRAVILRYGRIIADFYIDDIRSKGETLSSVMADIKRQNTSLLPLQ